MIAPMSCHFCIESSKERVHERLWRLETSKEGYLFIRGGCLRVSCTSNNGKDVSARSECCCMQHRVRAFEIPSLDNTYIYSKVV